MCLDLRLFDVCVLALNVRHIVFRHHCKHFLCLILWLELHKFRLDFRRVSVGVEISHDGKGDTHSHQERREQHVFCPLE